MVPLLDFSKGKLKPIGYLGICNVEHKMKRQMKFVVVAGGLFLLLTSYQNCGSKVNFTQLAPSQTVSNSSGNLSFTYQPTSIDFGKTPLNSNVSRTVTITNDSPTDNLAITQPVDQGPYHFSNSTCSSVTPKAKCSFSVSYQPTFMQSDNAMANIVGKNKTDTTSGSLSLSGQGFFIAPSSADVGALVGWYGYKPSQKLTFDNTQSGYTMCSTITSAGGHGQNAEYCYEQSGANGMTQANSNFTSLVNYILQPGSNFASVSTLDALFSSAADHTSDNTCFVQGLFYYALGYLIVPSSQNVSDPTWDIQFSIASVDDGLQMISNGKIMGNDYFGTSAQFSLNKLSATSSPVLNNGVNTLVAIWVDDCAVQRNIQQAKVQTMVSGVSSALPTLIPNVLRGYIYDNLTGKALVGAQVLVSGTIGNAGNAITDSTGFFSIQNLQDGTYVVTATAANHVGYSENVTLDHHAPNSAIFDFSRGL